MQRRRIMLASLLIFLTLVLAWVWAGLEIASPTRRALQDYHREFLEHPEEHGVKVTTFQLSDQTPCLMMEPDVDGKLGSRGKRIRDQLEVQATPLPEPGKIIGSLVLVHGRKGRKEDYLLIGERLCAVGFRCLLPDMPAHGEHPGQVATYGIGERQIPGRLLAEASKRFGFAPQPAGLLGMSMGGAVAVHSAAMPDCPWKTLVVVSSFDRLGLVLENNVSRRVGGWLGKAWLAGAELVYRLRTNVALADIRSDLPASKLKLPVLACHGTSDRVIPLSSGRKLFESVNPAVTKQWVEIPGADHHNVLITDFPIYAAITSWMLEHVR